MLLTAAAANDAFAAFFGRKQTSTAKMLLAAEDACIKKKKKNALNWAMKQESACNFSETSSRGKVSCGDRNGISAGCKNTSVAFTRRKALHAQNNNVTHFPKLRDRTALSLGRKQPHK